MSIYRERVLGDLRFSFPDMVINFTTPVTASTPQLVTQRTHVRDVQGSSPKVLLRQ